MNLTQLNQERLARQRLREQSVQKQPEKVLSDDEFLDLLYNETNLEREKLFEQAMKNYLSTRYNATNEQYYNVMDQYSQDIGASLSPKVLELLPETLNQVLSQLDEYSCGFYDYPDVSNLSQVYKDAVVNVEKTKIRTENLLNKFNTTCTSNLSSILIELNELIDTIKTITFDKKFKRLRIVKVNNEKLLSIKQKLTNFFEECWNGPIIPKENKFISGNPKLNKSVTFDSNLLLDVVEKENNKIIEELTLGENYCDENNFICKCINDNVTSLIILKLGLKDKYLKGDLDFGYIYYEFAAVWNIVNQNLVNVRLFDATDDMSRFLHNQKEIRNKYFIDVAEFVRISIEKFDTFGEFLPEEIETRLLIRDIFNIFKTNLGLVFEIRFETIENVAASEALARRLANQF